MEETQASRVLGGSFHCPDCGGAEGFDPESGKLCCPYCGKTTDIPASDAAGNPVSGEQDFLSAEYTDNCDWGAETKAISCASCGAALIVDSLVVSDVCPYCGSSQVTEAAAPKTLSPGGVCPFTVSEKQAGDAFKKWLKRRLFCPSAAKRSIRPDKLSGIYLPFWTFDAETKSRYRGKYGIDRTEKVMGKEKTVTDWYPAAGLYAKSFDDELIAGSNRGDASLIDDVAVYDTENCRAYRPEYLAGFSAERYSVGLSDAWNAAKEAIDGTLKSAIRSHILDEHNAHHVKDLIVETAYSNITYKYLLLPVWQSGFTYGKKAYRFVVNGRTGDVSGKTPISPWRVAIAVLIGLIVLAILGFLFANA